MVSLSSRKKNRLDYNDFVRNLRDPKMAAGMHALRHPCITEEILKKKQEKQTARTGHTSDAQMPCITYPYLAMNLMYIIIVPTKIQLEVRCDSEPPCDSGITAILLYLALGCGWGGIPQSLKGTNAFCCPRSFVRQTWAESNDLYNK